MKSNSLCVKIFLVHAIFLTFIILDIFFKDKLFDTNSSIILSIQSKSNHAFDIIFLICCNLMNPITITILCIIYYSVTINKINALVFLIYLIFISYLTSLLKMGYHDPRPYWTDSQIKAKECYMEYGNPSGHALMASFLIGSLWYETFLKLKSKRNNSSDSNSNNDNNTNNNQDFEECMIPINNQQMSLKLQKSQKRKLRRKRFFIFLSIFLAIIFILICFGRIYLGMHSYDQVLLGMVYGFYFLFIYNLIVQKSLVTFILFILRKNMKARKKNEGWCNFAILFKVFMIYIILLSIPIFVLEVYKSQTNNQVNWQKNIEIFCTIENKIDAFSDRCFIETGIIGFVFGILFGVTLPLGEYNPNLFMGSFDSTLIVNNQKKIGFKIIFARVFITLVGTLIWIGGFILIPHFHNIFIFFFINIGLGSFFSGTSLIILVQYIIYKCRMETQHDIIHYGKFA